MPDRNNKPDVNRSEQGVLNWSFDEVFRVLAVMSLGSDGQNAIRQDADDQQMKIVSSGGYTYICKAAVGTAEASALWKIFRLDSNGSKMYADGNANYDNIASDPTALTYSYT